MTDSAVPRGVLLAWPKNLICLPSYRLKANTHSCAQRIFWANTCCRLCFLHWQLPRNSLGENKKTLHRAAGLGSWFNWNLIITLEHMTGNNTVLWKPKVWVKQYSLESPAGLWFVCAGFTPHCLFIRQHSEDFWSRWCNWRKMGTVRSALQLLHRGATDNTWKLLNFGSLEVVVYLKIALLRIRSPAERPTVNFIEFLLFTMKLERGKKKNTFLPCGVHKLQAMMNFYKWTNSEMINYLIGFGH